VPTELNRASEPVVPNLEHIAQLIVHLLEPIEAGRNIRGSRRLIPITGGQVTGPRLFGRVLPGGADHQLIRTDGVSEIEARYVIETEDGHRIYVRNVGVRHGPQEAIDRLNRGELVDPGLIYFRTVVSFETEAKDLQWLMRDLFVGTGARFPDRVELNWFRVA
jgi:hypothetical protein